MVQLEKHWIWLKTCTTLIMWQHILTVKLVVFGELTIFDTSVYGFTLGVLTGTLCHSHCFLYRGFRLLLFKWKYLLLNSGGGWENWILEVSCTNPHKLAQPSQDLKCACDPYQTSVIYTWLSNDNHTLPHIHPDTSTLIQNYSSINAVQFLPITCSPLPRQQCEHEKCRGVPIQNFSLWSDYPSPPCLSLNQTDFSQQVWTVLAPLEKAFIFRKTQLDDGRWGKNLSSGANYRHLRAKEYNNDNILLLTISAPP